MAAPPPPPLQAHQVPLPGAAGAQQAGVPHAAAAPQQAAAGPQPAAGPPPAAAGVPPAAAGAPRANNRDIRLAETITSLKNVLISQGVHQWVAPYYGDKRGLKQWIKQIEKYATLSRIDGEGMKALAYQTARGPVSDYLTRKITEGAFAQENWAGMKANLIAKFAEVTDPSYAMQLLRQTRQRKDESVVVFSERLIDLADEALLGQPINNAAIERQLVGIFIDGLRAHPIRFKLLKANPQTMGAAIDLAVAEESLRRRFNLRIGRHLGQESPEDYGDDYAAGNDAQPYGGGGHAYGQGEYAGHGDYDRMGAQGDGAYGAQFEDPRDIQPMDINSSRPSRSCGKCGRRHARNMRCPTGAPAVRPRVVNSVNGRSPVCWNCGNPGHFWAQCEQPRYVGRAQRRDNARGQNGPSRQRAGNA